jgi:hypothetical protein
LEVCDDEFLTEFCLFLFGQLVFLLIHLTPDLFFGGEGGDQAGKGVGERGSVIVPVFVQLIKITLLAYLLLFGEGNVSQVSVLSPFRIFASDLLFKHEGMLHMTLFDVF